MHNKQDNKQLKKTWVSDSDYQMEKTTSFLMFNFSFSPKSIENRKT